MKKLFDFCWNHVLFMACSKLEAMAFRYVVDKARGNDIMPASVSRMIESVMYIQILDLHTVKGRLGGPSMKASPRPRYLQPLFNTYSRNPIGTLLPADFFADRFIFSQSASSRLMALILWQLQGDLLKGKDNKTVAPFVYICSLLSNTHFIRKQKKGSKW